MGNLFQSRNYYRALGMGEDTIDLVVKTPETVLGRQLTAALGMMDADPIVTVKHPAELKSEAIGTGKSTRIREQIAERTDWRFAVFTRTNALGDESREKLRELGVTNSRSYYGKTYSRANEGPVCAFGELADVIASAGGHLRQLCKRGRGENAVLCQHHATCPIFEQKMARPRVWYAPHAMLPFSLESKPETPIDAIIIDEDPISTLFTSERFSTDVLQNVRLEEEYGEIAAQITQALMTSDGRIRMGDLPIPYKIRELRKAVFRTKQNVDVAPNPSPHDQRRIKGALKLNIAATRAARFLEGLLQCMSVIDEITTIVHGIRTYRGSDGDAIVEVAFFNTPHPQYHTRTLILSATAQALLLRAVYPALRAPNTDWLLAEYATYVRIPVAGAISSLVKGNELCSQGERVQVMIRLLAKRHKSVLVVGQKALIKALDVPNNVDLENFGAVEGKDKWRNVDCVLVVGRPLPPPEVFWMAAERIAREVLADPGEWWSKDRDGRVRGPNLALPDYSHEHPVLNALLRSQCHAAVLQADRSRALHRTAENPVEVIFMNTVYMNDVKFDEVRDLKAYSGLHAQMALKGIILDPTANRGKNALIAALLPEMFENAKAVENYLRFDSSKLIDLEFDVAIEVRLPGTRPWVKVWVDAPDAAGARRLIEDRFPGAEVR